MYSLISEPALTYVVTTERLCQKNFYQSKLQQKDESVASSW